MRRSIDQHLSRRDIGSASPAIAKIVLGSCAALAAALALPRPAGATTLYVSPTGTITAGCTSRADACTLATATAAAVAGDTVVLMDGVYHEPLHAQASGTASAWITLLGISHIT